MDLLWLVILGFLLVGYFALEGFVLGAGLLLIRKGARDDTDASVRAFAPFLLANEVWLVAVAGVLMGGFPALEGTLLSGLYPFVVIGLVGWLVRDAGLWFRLRRGGRSWRRAWAWAIAAGSVLLTMAWGFVVGNLLLGVPEPPPSPGLFSPYALLWAVTMPVVFAVHGAAFMGGRLPEHLRADNRRFGLKAAGIALVLVAVAVVGGLGLGLAGGDAGRAMASLPLIGTAAVLWWIRVRLSEPFEYGYRTFALSAVGVCLPIASAGLAVAPELLEHAAGDRTLGVLAAYGLGALVLVLIAQVLAWRLFAEHDTPSFF